MIGVGQKVGKANSQLRLFTTFFIIFMIVALWLRNSELNSSWYWMFGLFLGFIFQRSKFCVSAAFRDITLFGLGSGMRAILLMVALINIIFFSLHLLDPDIDVAVMGYVDKWGVATALGAFIFGIGMVIAGGCVSGTFMRIGEGYLLQVVTFIGIAIGLIITNKLSFLFTSLYLPAATLNDFIAYEEAILVQLLMLFTLWSLSFWWERRI